MRTRLRLVSPMTLTVIAILGLSLEPAIGNRIGQEHLPT
jgi:hypothetical protein